MVKKVIAMWLVLAAAIVLACGCGADRTGGGDAAENGTDVEEAKDREETTDEKREIKEFTGFVAFPGSELNLDNDIQQIIAEKIGAICRETYLTGQTQAEAVGMMIASGEYPDIIAGGNSTKQLIEAGALIPLDEYWDDYPKLRDFIPDVQKDFLRQDDGHIYVFPQGELFGKDMTVNAAEAFWIQAKVLEWDNYPKIETLDQLFDLLERYTKANPTLEDGTSIIPYTILCYDWYYFCLENPPQFLDGYPNDGCCIVDPDTHQVIDYNTTPTAERYFKLLNEKYNQGLIDPEFMTMTRDEYIQKISSGRVLAMCDQYWNFSEAERAMVNAGMTGNSYVPLGLTIDEGMDEQYFTATNAISSVDGIGITISCDDVDGMLQYLSDMLDPEIQTLLHWGVEGVDYLVDEEGIFYRTDEMREKANDPAYKTSHLCNLLLRCGQIGLNPDGKNASMPSEQPGEFFATLQPEIQKAFEVYGAKTYTDMLDYNFIDGSDSPWYPMWTFSNGFSTGTEGGMAWKKAADIKHEYLPQVVIAKDFDTAWEEYLGKYNECNPQAYLDELQQEVYRRIEIVTGVDESAK